MHLHLSKATLLKLSQDFWLQNEDLEQINLALETIRLEEELENNRIKTVLSRDHKNELIIK